MFARMLGISDQDLIHLRRGALLHGIGKMGIPDAILRKPTPLNDAEMKILHTEPVLAYQVLASVEYLRPAADVPYCCHENWDGSGYPRGLKGEDISLSARVVAIVLAFDTLRSDRPDRRGMETKQALETIREQAGTKFDPQLVDVFLTMMES